MLNSIQNLVNKLQLNHNYLTKAIKEENRNLKSLRRKVKHTEQARVIIQKVAKGVQEKAHRKIAGVVSRCLKTVFDDPYDFQILFEEKRGKTEARLVFYDNDGNEIHPKDGAGQGQVDVAALALRLACLVLSKPEKRKVLFPDEPLKNVHGKDNRLRAAKLIETLAKEMGIQFVIVTGLEWLRVGKVINLSEEGK